jgi:hypothetical protein
MIGLLNRGVTKICYVPKRFVSIRRADDWAFELGHKAGYSRDEKEFQSAGRMIADTLTVLAATFGQTGKKANR